VITPPHQLIATNLAADGQRRAIPSVLICRARHRWWLAAAFAARVDLDWKLLP
jgi:hypothetical protein